MNRSLSDPGKHHPELLVWGHRIEESSDLTGMASSRFDQIEFADYQRNLFNRNILTAAPNDDWTLNMHLVYIFNGL